MNEFRTKISKKETGSWKKKKSHKGRIFHNETEALPYLPPKVSVS